MVDFELVRCQGLIKKLQFEVEELKNKQKEYDEFIKKINKFMDSQEYQNHIIKQDNLKIREKLNDSVKKKELAKLKPVQFTQHNIDRVKNMAIGMTKEQIAKCFNMSLTTYLKKEEEIPQLKAAFEMGQGAFMEEAVGILVKHIRDGCKVSLHKYLENKMKMKQDQDATNITITQEFLNKPLKIVNEKFTNEIDYENEIANKFHNNIMSITVSKNNQDEDDE